MKYSILWIIVTAIAIALALNASGYWDQDSGNGDGQPNASEMGNFDFSTN